jgi:hypothetical protein
MQDKEQAGFVFDGASPSSYNVSPREIVRGMGKNAHSQLLPYDLPPKVLASSAKPKLTCERNDGLVFVVKPRARGRGILVCRKQTNAR